MTAHPVFFPEAGGFFISGSHLYTWADPPRASGRSLQEVGAQVCNEGIMPLEITAAGWSAVAASLSAVSAGLTYLIHRQNQLESIRPQIVLEDWGYAMSSFGPVVTARYVKNVGRGIALNVKFMSNTHKKDQEVNAFVIGDQFRKEIGVVGPNDTLEKRYSFDLMEPMAAGSDERMSVYALYADTLGNRYMVKHVLQLVSCVHIIKGTPQAGTMIRVDRWEATRYLRRRWLPRRSAIASWLRTFKKRLQRKPAAPPKPSPPTE